MQLWMNLSERCDLFVEYIISFYAGYIATLLHRIAFDATLNVQPFIEAMPLSDDIFSVAVSTSADTVTFTCIENYVITFKRDSKTQSVTIRLNNDSIKLFSDDNDNYELECFLIDNDVFTNLRMSPVLAFLQEWLKCRTEPKTKFAKSVVDSVRDLIDMVTEAA